MNNTLVTSIEALLFALGRPLSYRELAAMLDTTEDDVRMACAETRDATERGVVLVASDTTVELRAAAHATERIEKVRRDEFSRDIGKAGLEVLAAILYRGPLTRSEIDFIRGVNSSQTVRTLLTRGLIQKSDEVRGGRGTKFEPTTELMAYLGLTSLSELPNYAEMREKLTALESQYKESAATNHDQ